MRILAVIPHYFDAEGKTADGRFHASVAKDPAPRIEALSACIAALHQHFDRTQSIIDIASKSTKPVNGGFAAAVEVVLCTSGDRHLIGQLDLDRGLFMHRPTDSVPMLLGFACRDVFRERLGEFDFYCYLEDDLIIHDPQFFLKLAWFNQQFGEENLLQPNRFEVARRGVVHKLYVDGDLAQRVIDQFVPPGDHPILRGDVLGQSISFVRPKNPHSGCYFLTAKQMSSWAARPDFLSRDSNFIGPLESTATLGILKTFAVYKPSVANAWFLEIEHFGTGFVGQVRMA